MGLNRERKFCLSIIHKKLLQSVQLHQNQKRKEHNKIHLTILKAITNLSA